VEVVGSEDNFCGSERVSERSQVEESRRPEEIVRAWRYCRECGAEIDLVRDERGGYYRQPRCNCKGQKASDSSFRKGLGMTEGEQRGLYGKYIVTKASGKPLAEGFDAMVLRIDGGRYVRACRVGVLAFAEAVRLENPRLYADIVCKVEGYRVAERQNDGKGEPK